MVRIIGLTEKITFSDNKYLRYEGKNAISQIWQFTISVVSVDVQLA